MFLSISASICGVFGCIFFALTLLGTLNCGKNRAENGKVDVLKIVGMKERVAE